mmetsp:Transcript_61440/g.101568  ORF Transcript_61440/g.101568 Transcript_61440/m.101568 type:complete len:247 (+) Transcript_61440:1359-2099(+)
MMYNRYAPLLHLAVDTRTAQSNSTNVAVDTPPSKRVNVSTCCSDHRSPSICLQIISEHTSSSLECSNPNQLPDTLCTLEVCGPTTHHRPDHWQDECSCSRSWRGCSSALIPILQKLLPNSGPSTSSEVSYGTCATTEVGKTLQLERCTGSPPLEELSAPSSVVHRSCTCWQRCTRTRRCWGGPFPHIWLLSSTQLHRRAEGLSGKPCDDSNTGPPGSPSKRKYRRRSQTGRTLHATNPPKPHAFCR